MLFSQSQYHTTVYGSTTIKREIKCKTLIFRVSEEKTTTLSNTNEDARRYLIGRASY